MTLTETLKNYSKSNMYPFHMPGHKRKLPGPYQIDMTEVEGVDDLHNPSGVLKNEQERLSKLYNTYSSFILVGGSTVGNLSAIYASLDEGDTILIQRNSHKSVYNGAILRHLEIEYIYPGIDEDGIYSAVTVDDIKLAIKRGKKPRAALITSPTYEGYLSNIDDIADYCHRENIILIVDEAHGAHLGFHKKLVGQAANKADVTIQSLHKTLPCLTQTAVLHVANKQIGIGRIRDALDIFETSSPSYVLMNSISQCIDVLEGGGGLFDKYVERLEDFYDFCGKLNHLSVLKKPFEVKDMGKLVIKTGRSGITGVELAKRLRDEYLIETELASFSYVLAMTSIMDTNEGFSRLKNALLEIDQGLSDSKINIPLIDYNDMQASRQEMMPWEAKQKSGKYMSYLESEGFVCQSMICIYPPGAPIIVPGELISSKAIEMISAAKAIGLHVTGLSKNHIAVVN